MIEGLERRGLGVSAFVSVGNKADVSSNDLLEHWEDDPATATIALYLESFGNPRRFGRIARRVARTKPVIALKGGSTPIGARAARSHTAALAGSDAAVEALFRQSGVLRATTLEELLDLTDVLRQPAPAARPANGDPDQRRRSRDPVRRRLLERRPRARGALPAHSRADRRRSCRVSATVRNPIDLIGSATPRDLRRGHAVWCWPTPTSTP